MAKKCAKHRATIFANKNAFVKTKSCIVSFFTRRALEKRMSLLDMLKMSTNESIESSRAKIRLREMSDILNADKSSFSQAVASFRY